MTQYLGRDWIEGEQVLESKLQPLDNGARDLAAVAFGIDRAMGGDYGTYPVTWSSEKSPGPLIQNGTLTGKYWNYKRLWVITAQIIFGDASTYSTAAGFNGHFFSLPAGFSPQFEQVGAAIYGAIFANHYWGTSFVSPEWPNRFRVSFVGDVSNAPGGALLGHEWGMNTSSGGSQPGPVPFPKPLFAVEDIVATIIAIG